MSRTRMLGLTAAIAALVSGAALTSSARTPDGPQEIQAVLDAMARAWNDDDLQGHVAPYAEDATYTLPDGLRHGRSGVMEALRGFQRDGDLLGELRFEDTAIRMMGDAHALVTGRFVLAVPERSDAAGRFTLVFANRNGTWEILHDHSS